jgi:hypothetical protein
MRHAVVYRLGVMRRDSVYLNTRWIVDMFMTDFRSVILWFEDNAVKSAYSAVYVPMWDCHFL